MEDVKPDGPPPFPSPFNDGVQRPTADTPGAPSFGHRLSPLLPT